jgi:hypothetical protein
MVYDLIHTTHQPTKTSIKKYKWLQIQNLTFPKKLSIISKTPMLLTKTFQSPSKPSLSSPKKSLQHETPSPKHPHKNQPRLFGQMGSLKCKSPISKTLEPQAKITTYLHLASISTSIMDLLHTTIYTIKELITTLSMDRITKIWNSNITKIAI